MILDQRAPGLGGLLARQKFLFEFGDDHLAVRLQGRKGIIVEKFIRWQEIPAQKYSHDAMETSAILQGLLILILIAALAVMFALRGFPASIYLTIEMTGATCILAIGLHYLLRRGSTQISAGQEVVSVFRVGNHDQIINEILIRRRKFFLQYATVDSAQSIRQNLIRFRWLVNIYVMGRKEFLGL